ncbi:ubiquitin related modifier URM1 [Cladorrhinum samala]|uniref:Ubiquitin-related modifier 1 n=1 Tax=Cladorrhinum samala TaxID=585594 RepID=A0AAV9HLN8_9PEZI|nr:ubiquitin related modifier URM1 [Cladorrhinum samala]
MGSSEPTSCETIPITVEFSGGLEMLFSNKAKHAVAVPSIDPVTNSPFNIGHLIRHLVDNLITDDRTDLFVLDDHLRPGILVLINDADWELEGEEEYEIQSGDAILFVSTLHGG